MEKLKCEILVIGAGPAGGAAARAAAESGADVLLVESRQKVGVPVQCAEFIPAMLKGQLNLKANFVAQKVTGMKTYRSDQEVTFTKAPGYIIYRDRFDQALAQAAEAAGVRLMTSTRAVSRTESGTVILRTKDALKYEVEAKVIIGADGPHSMVGKWVNAQNANLLPGVQVTMTITEALEHTEVYFRPDIFAGYGWLFPKNDVANVGLGLKKQTENKYSVRQILDRFVESLKQDGKITGEPRNYAAGWIPAEPVRQTVHGNVALVGDAAGHTHAITGAGIFASVIGGKMAGEAAGQAIAENDILLLEEYNKEWQDLMGDTLERAFDRRQYMEIHWEEFKDTVQKCWVAYKEYYG